MLRIVILRPLKGQLKPNRDSLNPRMDRRLSLLSLGMIVSSMKCAILRLTRRDFLSLGGHFLFSAGNVNDSEATLRLFLFSGPSEKAPKGCLNAKGGMNDLVCRASASPGVRHWFHCSWIICVSANCRVSLYFRQMFGPYVFTGTEQKVSLASRDGLLLFRVFSRYRYDEEQTRRHCATCHDHDEVSDEPGGQRGVAMYGKRE